MRVSSKEIVLSIIVLLISGISAVSQKSRLIAKNAHADRVRSISFSPDGKLIASSSEDHTIKLWDAVTGKQLRTVMGGGDSVYTIAFSPDGKVIASGGFDSAIRLWDATTGKQLRWFE